MTSHAAIGWCMRGLSNRWFEWDQQREDVVKEEREHLHIFADYFCLVSFCLNLSPFLHLELILMRISYQQAGTQLFSGKTSWMRTDSNMSCINRPDIPTERLPRLTWSPTPRAAWAQTHENMKRLQAVLMSCLRRWKVCEMVVCSLQCCDMILKRKMLVRNWITILYQLSWLWQYCNSRRE